MNSLLRTIIILLALSHTACVAGQSNLTAGNDEDKDIGLGGTGMLANTDSGAGSGLGGTGILGEITGFGSIFVNGIEIEYDDKTAFSINGKTVTAQRLEIGDVVEVLTVDNKQHTQAQMINLRHEVIGVVESVEAETYSFSVNGQSVVQSIDITTFPEAGSTVAVAGFRIDAQTILATRVTPAESGQVLLRTHSELPFDKKAQRWLIQTNIQDGKFSFQNNGITRSFALAKNTDKSVNAGLEIKILQLQKSAKGKVELKQLIEPVNIPRGHHSPNPVQQQGSKIIPNSISDPVLTPDSTSSSGAGAGAGAAAGANPGTNSGSGPAPTQTQVQPQMKQNGR